MSFVCCNCGGVIVYGEPHIMHVSDTAGERDTHWCVVCIEEYSDALWDPEWGPRKGKITHPKAGRA